MLMDLLKHRSVRPSQNVEDRLRGPPHPAMDHKMEIPTDDHEPSNSHINLSRSSATYHTAHSGPLPIPNTPLLAKLPPVIITEGVLLIPPSASDSSA